MRPLIARRFLIILLALNPFTTGCAYRFTNVAMKPPPGIHSIAVEAVYDVSREVVPHHLIWQSLQEGFARNGRLMLVDKSAADAIVLVRLSESNVEAIGTPEIEKNLLDPILDDGDIRAYNQYKNLKRSSTNTVTEQVSLTLDVKIVNLRSREDLFRKDYRLSGSFRSIRSTAVAARKTQYLLYEEALHARVKTLADQFAQQVVRDFLL